jgi:hypothetical protein
VKIRKEEDEKWKRKKKQKSGSEGGVQLRQNCDEDKGGRKSDKIQVQNGSEKKKNQNQKKSGSLVLLMTVEDKKAVHHVFEDNGVVHLLDGVVSSEDGERNEKGVRKRDEDEDEKDE